MDRGKTLKSPIARKLVIAVVLFSSFIALLMTSIQVYMDYRRDLGQIRGQMTLIEESYLQNVASSVWNYDEGQILIQLEGLLRLPDIRFLRIVGENELTWTAGEPGGGRGITMTLPLLHEHRGSSVAIGELTVVASLENVYRRLMVRALTILTGNAVKTFLVSGFILLIFQYLVTRHLVELADRVRGIQMEDLDGEITLSRGRKKGDKPDELDQVVRALGRMRARMRESFEEVRESEERFRGTFEHAAVGMCLTGTDGRFMMVNPSICRMLGYGKEELLSKDFGAITHPEDVDVSRRKVQALLKGEMPSVHFEKRYVHRNGETVWALVGTFLLRDAEGRPRYFITHIQDITHIKKLENRLRQAHKMEAIGTLAGGIAHDFNNILAVILGYAEMAKDDSPEWSPAGKSMDEIIKAGLRARDRVKHILDFCRKSEQGHSPVKISLVVTEALKLLLPSIPQRVSVEERIDHGCGNIMGSSAQLHQVVINLCTNGLQAMEEKGGVLTVELSREEYEGGGSGHEPDFAPAPCILLSIGDTGTGIDPAIMDRIFDPYFTTRQVGKGSGMGLSVVHGIVGNHGGTLRVEHREGGGTRVTVYFPVIEEAGIKEIPRTKALPTGHERILVVDDDRDMADMTLGTLSRLGYRVTAVTDSMEALVMFREGPADFDLVITDQTMPVLTGDRLAMELMEIRGDIPIILCTGYSTRMDAQKAGALGIKRFAMKPVDRKELAGIVREVLDEAPVNQ